MTAPLRPLLISATLLAPFAIAIKLSFANICILPAILLYLYQARDSLLPSLQRAKLYYAPIGVFLFIAFYSAFFGIHPQNSIKNAIKISYMFFLIPLYAEVYKEGYLSKVLLFLVLGLSIASTHTLFESAFPNVLFEYPHGPVSEAGQLAIGLFATLALLLALQKHSKSNPFFEIITRSTLPFLGFVVFGFTPFLSMAPAIQNFFAIVCALYILFHLGQLLISLRNGPIGSNVYFFVLQLALPLISAALLLNLKRGPWIGALVGLLVLLLIVRPKLLFLGIPLAIALFFGFDPIQQRALSSLEHFFMVGGRGEIWELGGELLVRYPLGIGLENAEVIKNFSYDIPTNLNHFHSNLINIAVELGWLGLAAYLWWIVVLLNHGLRALREGTHSNAPEHKAVVIVTLTCGILAWQVAGLFEYNFGDSEVFLLAMMVIGLITGALTEHLPQHDLKPELEAHDDVIALEYHR